MCPLMIVVLILFDWEGPYKSSAPSNLGSDKLEPSDPSRMNSTVKALPAGTWLGACTLNEAAEAVKKVIINAKATIYRVVFMSNECKCIP